ncbi:MAG: hypothetical protein CL607_27090 [Anaerolineaceae bacterium]|nr:hypothetical protein [Anaerolineaceae bacterium]
MTDYSLELSAERIYNSKTKKYFQEVLTSYVNENYRSALVMLWTVVVCDLIYKLQELQALYSDEIAKGILEEIEEEQKNNPHSPAWENKLLDFVKQRTVLLEEAEYRELVHLQQQRHLSAHPILTQVEILHRPSSDITRALIRSSLEAVLVKSPQLAKKIIPTFVQDVASKKELLIDDDTLKRYIEKRYLVNLKAEIENELFAAMWKFVFVLSNEDTDTNRDINSRVLSILYQRRPSEVRSYIITNKSNFNSIHEDFLDDLLTFLVEHPNLYKSLPEVTRTLVDRQAISSVDRQIECDFISPNLEEHFEKSLQLIKKELTNESSWELPTKAWERFVKYAKTLSKLNLVVDIGIDFYCVSNSFDAADRRFKEYILPHIHVMNETHILRLLDGIEKNSQTHSRNRATFDHKILKEHFDKVLGPDFDYKPYEWFMWTVER